MNSRQEPGNSHGKKVGSFLPSLAAFNITDVLRTERQSVLIYPSRCVLGLDIKQ